MRFIKENKGALLFLLVIIIGVIVMNFRASDQEFKTTITFEIDYTNGDRDTITKEYITTDPSGIFGGIDVYEGESSFYIDGFDISRDIIATNVRYFKQLGKRKVIKYVK